MALGYPIVFSELKSRVGVDDVAYSLGYRLDKRAGVGKYFELVLGDPRSPSDRIVVRNTSDKGRQTFFRRDGSKGDAVTLIRENLGSFNTVGANEWTRVANVLAGMANMPIPAERKSVFAPSYSQQVFDPSRYETRSAVSDKVPYILYKRGFDAETVRAFGNSVLLVRDKANTRFDGWNIGFPCIRPEDGSLAGYEIRGAGGFKAKAAGTDSAHSAWIADFPKNNCPQLARNVYFFESSLDAMAFYKMNKARISMSAFALVSTGGGFSQSIVESVMKRYPAARMWDCFDNDLAGNVYSSLLVRTVDGKDFSLSHNDCVAIMEYGGRQHQCPKERFDFRKAAIELGMEHSVGHWKSPTAFKDWNDCLMGKSTEPQISPSKYLRDENLADRRKSSLKI